MEFLSSISADAVTQTVAFMGTVVFAVSGALLASERGFDAFGVTVVGLSAAFGGGTLRDVLLGVTPVGWLVNPWPGVVAVAAALISALVAPRMTKLMSVLLVADAVGLGCFAVLGAQLANAQGVSVIGSVTLGVMTAVAGGMIRDLLCGDVPTVLRREIYATAAAIGAVVYLVMLRFGLADGVALLTGGAIAVVIRLIAIRLDLSLPMPTTSS